MWGAMAKCNIYSKYLAHYSYKNRMIIALGCSVLISILCIPLLAVLPIYTTHKNFGIFVLHICTFSIINVVYLLTLCNICKFIHRVTKDQMEHSKRLKDQFSIDKDQHIYQLSIDNVTAHNDINKGIDNNTCWCKKIATTGRTNVDDDMVSKTSGIGGSYATKETNINDCTISESSNTSYDNTPKEKTTKVQIHTDYVNRLHID